jgi:T-complex protein 1 subunit gamma
MKEYGIWEPFAVKSQTLKTAVESACLLLRVDDIVSGVSRQGGGGGGGGGSAQQEIEQNEMEAMAEAAAP